jgi:naringenin degradation protein FdeE
MTQEDFADAALPLRDVLVVGGGLGGLSAAIALGRRGVRTTVLERDAGVLGAGANIGINYRPVYALEELGILDEALEQGQSYPVGEDSRFEAVYDAKGNRLPVGAPPDLGEDWRLPVSSVRFYRPVLSEIMKKAAREQGVELLIGHSYRSLEPRGDVLAAKLTTGEERPFDLVVAADGIHSELRERFFPQAPAPVYTGQMICRVMLEDAPEDWRGGAHLPPEGGERIVTSVYPDRRFYLATGKRMERRHVDQDEARAIVRGQVAAFGATKMFEEIHERITDDVHVIVTPCEWIFVSPPWHRGRLVLLGDAVHATAPTIGSAGGMAIEDGVVLAQELARTHDVEAALSAYAARREGRTKLVVETSAALMRSHHERRPHEEEAAMRFRALQQLVAPY